LALVSGAVLTILTPLQGALIVGLLVVLAATLIEPLVGLALALFVGLLRAYLHTEVPQVPAQIGQVFVGLALAAWLARSLVRRELRITRSPVLVTLVVFVGAALLSLWDTVGLSTFGVPELIKWVQIALLVLLVSDRLDRRRLPWLLAALIAIGVFQGVVGVWQFGLRGEGPDHFAILGGDYFRAYGTFEQPNPYAGYLGLTASLALGISAVGLQERVTDWRARFSRAQTVADGHSGSPIPDDSPDAPSRSIRFAAALLVGAGGVILIAALGMSWSRGAWVGFGAAVLVMAIGLPQRATWGIVLVVALVATGGALYAAELLPSAISTRLTGFAEYVKFEDVRGVGINDTNYSIIERFAHWQAALAMFRDNFWTGVGFGAYEPAYPPYALINWPYALGHAHNYYLTIAAETGVIGLVAYTALWIVVYWQTWRATRDTHGLAKGSAIGLLGAWTHLSVHSLLDNLYVNNVHLQIGVMLGILVYLVRRPEPELGDA
jgi:O-antigen ligase